MNAPEGQVFINCPFDEEYRPLFEAIVFAVHACGFTARCSLEVADSGQARIEKIYRIVGECGLGIHDISRTESDQGSGLPRFNMPLELGLFLGAKRFGPAMQKRKLCLILDRDPYRYQQSCSDIAGQDIKAHRGDCGEAIRVIRDWLRNTPKGLTTPIPGGAEIAGRYDDFRAALPELCRKTRLAEEDLIFVDYGMLIAVWLKRNLQLGATR